MAITPQQIQAAENLQHAAVHDTRNQIRLIAGPGTGKSFAIEETVCWLLRNQGRGSQGRGSGLNGLLPKSKSPLSVFWETGKGRSERESRFFRKPFLARRNRRKSNCLSPQGEFWICSGAEL
jgi:hypothetical protein